jgi:carbonic anhydrase
MHGPAEHRLDNVQYDLEVHIVHELVDGPHKEDYKETLAVIGFFFEVSDHSHPFIEKLRPHDFGKIDQISFNELFQTLSHEENAASPQEMTSTKNRFYHYKGSLTNPPCADVVNWILYKKVLPITETDLNAFKGIWMKNLGFGNYRDCQPLCGRKIVRNFEKFEEEGEGHVHTHACSHAREHHLVHHI